MTILVPVRRLLLVLMFICFAAPALAQTVTLTNPTNNATGWKRTGQVVPNDNGAAYATVTLKGTYTGTIPTNIDVRFCTDNTCATVAQTWVTGTGCVISGGNWSCTWQVQNSWSGTTSFLYVQSRETNATAVTSSVSSSTFATGEVLGLWGQSNMQKFWTVSAYTQDGSTNSNLNIGSTLLFTTQTAPINRTGVSITGTNIPNGNTISSINSGAGTAVMSGSNATGTGTGQTMMIEIGTDPGVGNATAIRYQSGTGGIQPVGGVPVSGEGQFSLSSVTAPYGHMEGAVTLANTLGAGINGGVFQYQAASGGTSICAWVSAAVGSCPGTGANSFILTSNFNNDMTRAIWVQGESDTTMSQSDYLAALRNIEAIGQGIRSGSAFMVVPVRATVDSVRQAQLQAIDGDSHVYWGGGMLDLPADSLHLYPASKVTLARRMTQAILRQSGLSSSGYGPVISSVTCDGSVTCQVHIQHEAGTALTSHNLSSSGSSLTGFSAKCSGVANTIAATSFTQPATVVLTLTTPCSVANTTVAYQAGSNPIDTNAVYDNVPPQGDAQGLPLQPSRGPYIQAAGNAPTCCGRMFLRGADNDNLALPRVAHR